MSEPSTPEITEGTAAEIAAVDAKLAEIKSRLAPGEKLHGAQLKAFQSLCMKKAGLCRRLERRPRGAALRLVKAVAAERVAGKAIEEVAAMVADTTTTLRLGINRYGAIARGPLAEKLLAKLNCGDKEREDEAISQLLDLFTRMVDMHGDLRARTAGRKARPGWPSEGSKG